MLLVSVAPCDRCLGKHTGGGHVKLVYPPEGPGTPSWSGAAWPPPVGARVQHYHKKIQNFGTVLRQFPQVEVRWDNGRTIGGYTPSELLPLK